MPRLPVLVSSYSYIFCISARYVGIYSLATLPAKSSALGYCDLSSSYHPLDLVRYTSESYQHSARRMVLMNPVTPNFLNQLKSIFPVPLKTSHYLHPVLDNPWYIVASVAFCASNRPDGVASVYKFVSVDLNENNHTDKDHALLVKRLRDALFKAGITCGYPKAINGLIALNEAVPQVIRDSISTTPLSDTSASPADLLLRGDQTFARTYGENTGPVQNLLNTISPDMGYFTQSIGYGLIFGNNSVLSAIEASYVFVTSIIAGDTPKQINWHLAGARRQGGTLEEVRAVRRIAMEAAAFSGITWRDGVPEVAEDISDQS